MEQQKGESEWQACAHVNDSLAHTMKSLSPGIAYRFRVRAKNVHGCSEPGQISEDVMIAENAEQREKEDLAKSDTLDGKTFCKYANSIVMRDGGDFKSRFVILEELGKGRFGTVHKVIERETEQVFAAKIVKCIKAKDKAQLREEIAIMRALNHPKLLRLAITFEVPREIIMIME